MTLPFKYKWLSLTVLAILIPTGLLTAFKLTGIIPEPTTIAETTTLEPVSWTMERPSTTNTNIGEKVENAYADSEVAVGIGAHIAWYVENPSPTVGPFFGQDGICFVIYTNFSAFHSHGVSIRVKCHPTDDNATVYVDTELLAQNNVSVTGIKWFGNSASEAYVDTDISSSPCYLKEQAYWVFNDQNNENHQLDLAFEITYFNGTIYRRLVLPMTLQVLISTASRGS